MQSRIKRAISSSINDKVMPVIQNIMGGFPLDHNGTGTALKEQGLGNVWKEPNTKFTKKDSRSACDLRKSIDFTPYIIVS